jgi:hypothetical protein
MEFWLVDLRGWCFTRIKIRYKTFSWFCFVWDRVSVCSPGWLQTCDLLASASQVKPKTLPAYFRLDAYWKLLVTYWNKTGGWPVLIKWNQHVKLQWTHHVVTVKTSGSYSCFLVLELSFLQGWTLKGGACLVLFLHLWDCFAWPPGTEWSQRTGISSFCVVD